jgi:hypothetical protein
VKILSCESVIRGHWPQLAMLSASRELRICGIFGSTGLSLVWNVKGALLPGRVTETCLPSLLYPSQHTSGRRTQRLDPNLGSGKFSVSFFEQCREHVRRIRKGATYRNWADPSAARSYLAYVLGIGLVPRRDQRRMRTCRLPTLTCLRMR